MGQHTVPLIEDHAATRERWSLNSLTDSAEEQISDDNMPGFEIMFKAEGKQVEPKLQAYVAKKQIMGMRVTVVTGPSGSYRENDILNFLEKHLPPWGPGRRWEIFLLDAYAPGLTDNVQRFGWSRGYIVFTHGGGASMVTQTNDTDLHQWTRKRFIENRRRASCCERPQAARDFWVVDWWVEGWDRHGAGATVAARALPSSSAASGRARSKGIGLAVPTDCGGSLLPPPPRCCAIM